MECLKEEQITHAHCPSSIQTPEFLMNFSVLVPSEVSKTKVERQSTLMKRQLRRPSFLFLPTLALLLEQRGITAC